MVTLVEESCSVSFLVAFVASDVRALASCDLESRTLTTAFGGLLLCGVQELLEAIARIGPLEAAGSGNNTPLWTSS